jgi:Anaerobic ribonucleoside-triphosphate reductase
MDMTQKTFYDISVEYPQDMTDDEVRHYVLDERRLWNHKCQTLGRVELSIDGDEVVIKSYERSPIRRVRRITGYLSEVKNFNDAKRSELGERSTHA